MTGRRCDRCRTLCKPTNEEMKPPELRSTFGGGWYVSQSQLTSLSGGSSSQDTLRRTKPTSRPTRASIVAHNTLHPRQQGLSEAAATVQNAETSTIVGSQRKQSVSVCSSNATKPNTVALNSERTGRPGSSSLPLGIADNQWGKWKERVAERRAVAPTSWSFDTADPALADSHFLRARGKGSFGQARVTKQRPQSAELHRGMRLHSPAAVSESLTARCLQTAVAMPKQLPGKNTRASTAPQAGPLAAQGRIVACAVGYVREGIHQMPFSLTQASSAGHVSLAASESHRSGGKAHVAPGPVIQFYPAVRYYDAQGKPLYHIGSADTSNCDGFTTIDHLANQDSIRQQPSHVHDLVGQKAGESASRSQETLSNAPAAIVHLAGNDAASGLDAVTQESAQLCPILGGSLQPPIETAQADCPSQSMQQVPDVSGGGQLSGRASRSSTRRQHNSEPEGHMRSELLNCRSSRTTPKAFGLEERALLRPQSTMQRRLEEDQAQRAALLSPRPFKANALPRSTTEPRYQAFLQRQQERRAYNKQAAKGFLVAEQRPFSFYRSPDPLKATPKHEGLSGTGPQHHIKRRFKANPVPASTHEARWMAMQDAALQKAWVAKLRAASMLTEARLPSRMEAATKHPQKQPRSALVAAAVVGSAPCSPTRQAASAAPSHTPRYMTLPKVNNLNEISEGQKMHHPKQPKPVSAALAVHTTISSRLKAECTRAAIKRGEYDCKVARELLERQ